MKKLFQNPYFLLFLITIAGAGLRFYNLGFKSLWYDEAVSYWNAQGSLQEVLQHNLLRDSIPPTFSFVIHYISKFGNSEFTLRLIPCVAGILAIPAAFLLFKHVVGAPAACAVSILVAFAPRLVEHSQFVRPYSMVLAVAFLIVYFAYRIAAEDKKSNFVFYSIILCVAVFLHYGLPFVIASTCIILAVEVLRKKQTKKVLPLALSLIAPLISVGLVYNISLNHHIAKASGGWGSKNYLQHAYWDGALSSLFSYVLFNSESIIRFSYASHATSLLGALVLLGIYACIKGKKWYPLTLAVVLFSMSMALGLASIYPYAGCRQTVYLVIPVYLLAGMGFSQFFQNRSTKPFFYVILFVFAAYGLVHSFVHLHRESSENIKPILSKLNSNWEPSDKLHTNFPSLPAVYYYLGRTAEDAGIFYQGRKGREKNLKTLEALASQAKRLWLVYTRDGVEGHKRTLSILGEKNARLHTFYESESGLQKLILVEFE